jgi:epoxyqueuosine reductase QueG
MDAKKLTQEITALAKKTGAELVGFTSAKELETKSPINHRPSDLLKNAKSIITLACGRSLNEDRDYIYNWGPDFSLTYIRLKDEVKYRRREARGCIDAVKNFLQQNGYSAVTEPHGWSGILSFKMTSYLGGLGVFGKGSFVVELEYDKPLKMDVCKDCTECIKACKYGAFKKEGSSYKWLGDKCRCYDLIMNPVTLKWTYGPCNSKCVSACPIGK